MIDQPDRLTFTQAREYLGVSRNTLYRWIREGYVPHVQVMQGGRYSFRKATLDKWIQEKEQQGQWREEDNPRR